jgi:hypothetical protein
MSISLLVIAAIGAVALFNLLLTYGLIRRVRALDQRIGGGEALLPHAGRRIEAFAASTTEGITVTEADLADGEHVVALLSAGCGSCESIVAELAERRSGTRPWLFLHDAHAEGADGLVAAARQAGRVALVDHGPVSIAFGVQSFPAVLRIVDGLVAGAGHNVREAGIV